MWLHSYSQSITEGFGKAQGLHPFWVPSSRRTAVMFLCGGVMCGGVCGGVCVCVCVCDDPIPSME